MSEYVDFYELKRAQAETGLSEEAKRTMIDLLFEGETREDDDISLNRFMKMHHLKAEAVNLLMQDCDDKIIREDLVERVKSTRLPKGEALQRMVNLSTPVTVATRRKAAISLLIGSEEEAKEKAEKKAKGKKNQEKKATKKKAKREKNQEKKATKKPNRKRDNKGKKKKN